MVIINKIINNLQLIFLSFQKTSLLFGLSISLVGCVVNEVDPQNNSCLPPCWNSIIPGHTTKQESLNLAEVLVAKNNFNFGEINGNLVLTDITSENTYYITISNGVVSKIFGLFVNEEKFVEDIVNQLGEPPIYFATKHLTIPSAPSELQTNCEGWSNENYLGSNPAYGILIYPELGVSYTVLKHQEYPNYLCPEVLVVNFTYTEQRKPLEWWHEQLKVNDEHYHNIKWHGYGGGY